MKCLCFFFCCKKPHRNQQQQNQQQHQQQQHTQQSLAPSPSLKLQHGRNGKSFTSNTVTTTINGKTNGKPLTLANEERDSIMKQINGFKMVLNDNAENSNDDWDKQQQTLSTLSMSPLHHSTSRLANLDSRECEPFLRSSASDESATSFKKKPPNTTNNAQTSHQMDNNSNAIDNVNVNANDSNCIDLSWIWLRAAKNIVIQKSLN